MAKEREIADEYSSSLADLTMNSKPLINMLTILAEESIDHATVIVQSVETHLDKVSPDIKLPVLYLVDSIIKNVGGAYTQLFSQSIVGMFCRVFKEVDERTRSQMFKLRETWHDVFPSIKLYQLDVKVNLIDPAWPIQAQPTQSGNIHVNPNFFIKTNSDVSSSGHAGDEEMRKAVAIKEQELLLLQKKKVEMELEHAKKLLEESKREKNHQSSTNFDHPGSLASTVIAVPKNKRPQGSMTGSNSTGTLRIAPVSSALLNRVQRRDPRLARDLHHHTSEVNPVPSQVVIVPDNKVPKSDKNIRYSKTFDVHSDLNKDDKLNNRSQSCKKDPRLNRNKHVDTSPRPSKPLHKRPRTPIKASDHRPVEKREKSASSPESMKVSQRSKLPPIPKIKLKISEESHRDIASESLSPTKKNVSRISNTVRDKPKKIKLSPNENKLSEKRSKSPNDSNKKSKFKPLKYDQMEIDLLEPTSPTVTEVTFKELKGSTKERNYIRRNREKSESPEKSEEVSRNVPSIIADNNSKKSTADIIGNGVNKKDVDLRLITKSPEVPISRKRSSSDKSDNLPSKRSKSEKFDALFGDEDVDLRTLPLIESLPLSPSIIVKDSEDSSSMNLGLVNEVMDGNWAKVKEIQSPLVETSKSQLDMVRAKLAAVTKSKDPLGRPLLYKHSTGDNEQFVSQINPEDTDMRQHAAFNDLDGETLNSTIQTILSQAEENLKSGDMDKDQYNVLIRQVLQLNETQKLKEAQQKDSLETRKRKQNWLQKCHSKQISESSSINNDENEGANSPQSDEIDEGMDPAHQSKFSGMYYGDIDERFVLPAVNMPSNINDNVKRPPLLPRPNIHADSDIRTRSQRNMYDNPEGMFNPRGFDMRFPGRHMGPRMFVKGWRGSRPRMEERGGFRPMMPRGMMLPPNVRRMSNMNRPPFDSPGIPQGQFLPKPVVGSRLLPCPIVPYVNDGSLSPPPLGAPLAVKEGFPPLDSNIFDYIENDTMKTIQIDGAAREIRYYDKTAIILQNWDDPREISFAPGHRRIFLDDEVFVLGLHDDYVNVTIDGQPHRIRFGGPTREVYIDESWFESFFGGPPIQIMLDNKVKFLKLEGPPPQVNIGKVKRTDLVAGKINLIIDATTMLPVFLDAKLQKFEIEYVTHSLRFVDSLQTILINEKPFKVEFGGLPKPLVVGGKKHFVRFSVLPPGIKAGYVHIQNMEGKKPALLPTIESNIMSLNLNTEQNTPHDMHLQHPAMGITESVSGGLDVLASLMPSSMAPASQFSGYSIAETATDNTAKTTTIPGLDQSHQDMSVPPPNISSILKNVNVNDLFAKLVATGIVTTVNTVTNPTLKTEAEESNSKPVTQKPLEKNYGKPQISVERVDLMKSETLKVRQPGLVALLHTGMQCGGCGARFPPEHTVRYSQHLDWHFRQNRADKHSQRRPNSRRWYYDISDWIQYQEIEDLEEREKNWFEREQQAAEAAKSEEAAVIAARRDQCSVPLKSGAPPEHLRCHLCHDSFNQFYNHDIDEWHLRNAVEHEGNNYHPLCLDDYKQSLIKEHEQIPDEETKESTLIDIDVDKDNNENDTTETEDVPICNASESMNEPNIEIPDQDNESIVEVLSEEANTQESNLDNAPDVELVEEDDDVVIKNEPVEQIIVDDVDTDEETELERRSRNVHPDGMPIDFANIKIKQEPIDPDDEPIITSESVITTQVDTTSTSLLSSIDGNVQLQPTTQVAPNIPIGGIRINITKPIASQPKEKEVVQPPPSEVTDEPCPPGEEPLITFKLKPSLEGKSFVVQPPCDRGTEMSGLCSIM